MSLGLLMIIMTIAPLLHQSNTVFIYYMFLLILKQKRNAHLYLAFAED